MFENIVNFFKNIGKKEENKKIQESSKDAAKERLHLVLMQDRANVSADFLELMKQEIIEVIKKYIEVDEKEIDVRLTNKENDDGTNGAPALYANIPILNIKNDARKVGQKELEEKKENKEKTQENKKEEKESTENKKEEVKQNEQKKTEEQEIKDQKEDKKAEIKKENKDEDNTQKKPENKEIEEQEKIRKIIDGVLEGTEKNKKENKETEEEQEAKA